jgi:hypothetical protein
VSCFDNRFRYLESHLGRAILHSLTALVTKSPLVATVAHIVFGGPEEKMIRSDAAGVIAAVTDDHTNGDGTMPQLVRESMRANVAIADAEVPIASRAAGPLPFPATLGISIYLAPEAFFWCRWRAPCGGRVGHPPPPFIHTVTYILPIRAGEEVVWIDTETIVATVADKGPIRWDHAVNLLVSKAVGTE